MPYSHIRTITLDNSEKNGPKGKVSIMVYLTSPPLVANVEMNSPDASHLYAEFQLQNDTVGRFMEALRRRGVVRVSQEQYAGYSLVTGKVELSQFIDEIGEKAQEYFDRVRSQVHKRQFPDPTNCELRG